MKILVINTGSSSIKYELFTMTKRQALASGQLEQIGQAEGRMRHSFIDSDGQPRKTVTQQPIPDHRTGLNLIGKALKDSGVVQDGDSLDGIGHRVVHGGEVFKEPTLINEVVIAAIRAQSPLAPLHNPANLIGIEEACRFAPTVPQVAVFDTAFHQTIPSYAYRYAIPKEDYEKHHVRRYGFHGTSHYYVTQQAAAHLGKPMDETNVIVFHLGNGASATAIVGGRSVDTSMGMTPLEGLIMGTRSGDIDPAVIFYLSRVTDMTPDEIDNRLNKASGLKGICGVIDMREVLEKAKAGDPDALLARQMTAYRIKKYLGAYYAVLNRVDAIVFTGGIGENDSALRQMVCTDLNGLGIELDQDKNAAAVLCDDIQEIQNTQSQVKLLVIPTNEELQIATQAAECISKSKS